MSNTVSYQTDVLAKAHVPSAGNQGTEAELHAGEGVMDTKAPAAPEYSSQASDIPDLDDKPTEEELHTLRRVSGQIKWSVYTIAFAELCERFSYYGSAVLYTNFVQWPLPEGSTTGANFGTAARTPGALGMGQKASTGLGLFNQFFAYMMPLLG
jgi:proton-dependent oligopeptide transporter, POT family